IGNGHAVVFVQLALPAVIEQSECRVTALLNFGKHDARADGVTGASRDVDDVALCNWMPLDQCDDRPVPDRHPQFLRRYPALEPNADLRAWFCRDDVPCLALAVWHSH